MQRTYHYQVVEYQRFSELASEEHYLKKEIVPRRGDILDRNGHPLAISVMYQTLYAYPPSVKDFAAAAKSLAKIIGEPQEAILTKLQAGGSNTVVIKRKLPAEA